MERLLAPLNLAWQGLPAESRQNPHLIRGLELMVSVPKEGKRGLDSITLTPVGRILGACAYSIATGEPFRLGDGWDDPS